MYFNCITAGENKTKYKVRVWTGDIDGAGTDANVFINLIGKDGESGKLKLDNVLRDDFRRAQLV
jgi:hypothetical protein